MTTQEVANRLVDLCRKGEWDKVYEELYSQDCESKEPAGAPNAYVKGMDAILKKGENFNESVEAVHSSTVSDPIVADNFFSCVMAMNITFKGAPGPIDMEEICLYHVADGKVISEQFFYTPEPQMA